MKEPSEWTQMHYRLTVFRVLCALGAVSYLAYWLIVVYLVKNADDPLDVRFGISTLYIAALAASYVWPGYFARYYDGVTLALAVVTTVHLTWLAVHNDYHSFYVACVFSGFAACGVLINSTFYMAVLTVVAFVTSLEGLRYEAYASVLGFSSLIVFLGTVLIMAAEWRRRSVVHMQSALRRVAESEDRFRRLADTSPMMVWMTNAQRATVYFSRTWRTFVGAPAEANHREFATNAMHPEDREEVLALVSEAEQAHLPYEVEFRLRRADGEYRYVLARGVPRFSGSTFEGFIGNVVDLTERHRAEEERNELRARIAIASQLAALGEMAGGIAHEINNPLMIIDAYVRKLERSLAEDPIDRAAVQRMAAQIVETVARIAGIVRSMRSLSRQVQDEDFERADLAMLVQDALSLCAEKCRNEGIELQVAVPEHVTLQCRPGQIAQVLLNLLGNASDAVHGREDPWVRIETHERNDEVEIHVLDNGAGVPSEMRDKIFQPFFTTKPVGKGTGLGLSISKTIIEAHGGRIGIEQEGNITRFVVVLPKDPKGRLPRS